MAKKENQTKSTQVIDEDNIVETLNKGNLPEFKENEETLGEKALAELQKEKDERKKNQIKSCYAKADYKVKKSLIDLHHSKELMKSAKYEIAQMGRLQRFMTGFVVTDEVLTHAKGAEDLFKKEKLDGESLVVVTADGEKTFKKDDKVPAIIDVVDFDKCLETLRSKLREMRNAADIQQRELIDKLDASYGQYWSTSWRY